MRDGNSACCASQYLQHGGVYRFGCFISGTGYCGKALPSLRKIWRTNISVEEGSHVEKGEVLGTVAAPTKYYSVEGTNAYFALTLDEVAVDPMGPLQ